MKTPGISVRPIKLLDGGHEVNEVFFDNVRVPLDNRIGEEGKGWTYAKLLLTHERTGIAQVAFSRERLQRFKALFKTEQARGITTATQALLTRTAQVEIELDALEMTELRCLAAVSTGAAPGPESSILKIKGSEIMQSIDELFLDLAGHYGLAHRRDFFVEGEGEAIGPWYAAATGNHYFNNRKVSIYGGSNEIQKNIIAKQVLGI
jgi:alkylation response protein AidB-like acyl-CoA dehydrogenase